MAASLISFGFRCLPSDQAAEAECNCADDRPEEAGLFSPNCETRQQERNRNQEPSYPVLMQFFGLWIFCVVSELEADLTGPSSF
jgi:hypothetical protein